MRDIDVHDHNTPLARKVSGKYFCSSGASSGGESGVGSGGAGSAEQPLLTAAMVSWASMASPGETEEGEENN